jgi:hypothetical protein
MIKYHIANSVIDWSHRHVKGHQDLTIPYAQLSVIAQANVDVDELAKMELQQNRKISCDSILKGQCWQLNQVDNKGTIQGNIEAELQGLIYEDKMRTYWGKNSK